MKVISANVVADMLNRLSAIEAACRAVDNLHDPMVPHEIWLQMYEAKFNAIYMKKVLTEHSVGGIEVEISEFGTEISEFGKEAA